MSATPTPWKPARRIARDAVSTMRSWVRALRLGAISMVTGL